MKPRGTTAVLGFGLWACHPPASVPATSPCDGTPPATGAVWARRVACSDELSADGEARTGDWILANEHVRYVFRDEAYALTMHRWAGGTLLDAATWDGPDMLVEGLPLQTSGGSGLAMAAIEATAEGDVGVLHVTGSWIDGTPADFRYTLAADDWALGLEQVPAWRVVPVAGTARFGQTLERLLDDGSGTLIRGMAGADGEVQDDGGWVTFSAPKRFAVGDADTVLSVVDARATTLGGTSDGEWVEALDSTDLATAHVVAHYPVADGAWSGLVPSTANGLRAVRDGFSAGPIVPVTDGADVHVGAEGWLAITVVDSLDRLVPASVTWNGVAHSLLPGDGALGVGGGTSPLEVRAGPLSERATVDSLTLDGTRDLLFVLDPVAEGTLAALGVEGSPTQTVRRSPWSLAADAAADGSGYVVFQSADDVPDSALDARSGAAVIAQAGVRSTFDAGDILSWPWAPTPKLAGHGAPDPDDPGDALDHLSVASDRGGRWSMVDADFVASAGDPLTWQGWWPDVVKLRSLDDLPAYTALLDAWIPVAPASPWVFIPGLESPPAPQEVEAALARESVVATNGPVILFTVDGLGPGEVVPTDAPTKKDSTHEAILQVRAPSWMALDHAAIVGPNGTVATFALGQTAPIRLDVVGTVQPTDWLIAIAWGDSPTDGLLGGADTAWAVTGPVWMARP